ncbi:metallophosphoesterase [uncultured Shewanella sp.]|uniref:metallophosphoesterase family protein n=1 Tax=uncultured Shewanella sp. TaxID=173975 RepID=UPI00262E31C0|nr:metallophosphoesterase [uncultured Shewanella sp.]
MIKIKGDSIYYITLILLTIFTSLLSKHIDAKEQYLSQADNLPPKKQNISGIFKAKTPHTLNKNEYADFNIILGQATDTSITVNLLVNENSLIYCEYGLDQNNQFSHTEQLTATASQPIALLLSNLSKNTQYYYRIIQQIDGAEIHYGSIHSFYTQREKSQTFSFGVQEDSHPERAKTLYHSELYKLNIANIAFNKPDLFFMLGDDFSIESLIADNSISQEKVNHVYASQRDYLQGAMHSTALYLINGNHEQAARYIYEGNFDYNEHYSNLAYSPIYAANARSQYYALPSPSEFYSGDHTQLESIGLLKDYYAWEWGDALFVTLDPYWHSAVAVDSGIPPLYEKSHDIWEISMGDEQYHWLNNTLKNSTAKYKFVFAHHINGRGAASILHNAEWGGYDKNAKHFKFNEYRPNWELPIHQLMVQKNVTIFFHGHDHVFSKEVVDDVIYQSLPSPADNSEDS